MGLENHRIEDGLTIDLALEADFRLGALSVIPSAREVVRDGIREILEPRVMQVLVALARAGEAVVSRDELIQTCWDGRVVGEDSINRVIWRLRKLAEGDGPAPFVIETIPRVGYRLKSDHALGPPAAKSPETAPGTSHFGWWRPAIVSFAATIMALAVWSFWPIRQSASPALIPLIAGNGEPVFAPDGTMLTYLSQPGARPIYMSAPSGGEGIRASGARNSGNAPSWSPDGTQLAYVARDPGGACRIMVVVLKEGKAREAGHCKAAETSSLAWQPGTSFLYFADQADASGNAIFRLDLRNGREQRMTGAKQANATWR